MVPKIDKIRQWQKSKSIQKPCITISNKKQRFANKHDTMVLLSGDRQLTQHHGNFPLVISHLTPCGFVKQANWFLSKALDLGFSGWVTQSFEKIIGQLLIHAWVLMNMSKNS